MNNRTTTVSAAARTSAVIGRGFKSPVIDAQATFRAVLQALAEPGTIASIPAPLDVCPGFSPAMTALALSLADFETPIWTDAGTDADDYLRFHTGAPVVASPASAAFAFLTKAPRIAPFATFAQGTLDDPDRSTTLLIDVEALGQDGGWTLSGPGIDGARALWAAPLPSDFVLRFQANRKRFPCGVDIVFCAGTRIAGLPRSTRIAATERD